MKKEPQRREGGRRVGSGVPETTLIPPVPLKAAPNWAAALVE
jgi:hypothetical protein